MATDRLSPVVAGCASIFKSSRLVWTLVSEVDRDPRRYNAFLWILDNIYGSKSRKKDI